MKLLNRRFGRPVRALAATGGINDRGEIAAQANVVSDGVVTAVAHAILLIPCGSNDPIAYSETQQIVIPDDVQRQMRRHINWSHFLLSATQQ
jgi:hypothetical protein